jgi:hypothetical protein
MAFLQTTAASISSGGTITGDITIEGDLTVEGGGSLSFDEIIEGTQVIDVDSTEALLVRKNGDGGDVFTVDTSNMDVTVNGAKNTTTFSVTNNWSTTNDYIRIALNDATIRSTVLNSGARNLIFAPLGNDALTLHSTSGGAISAGIGTSTPQAKLTVEESTAQPALVIDQSAQQQLSGIRLRTNRHDQTNKDDNWDMYTSGGGDLRFEYLQSANDAYPNLNTGFVNWLTITGTGRVGIGSQHTSPATALDIKGTDNTSSKITLTNTAPSPDNIWSIHANYNSQALAITGDSNQVMTFLDTGEVGIGVASVTDRKLFVSGGSASRSDIQLSYDALGNTNTDGVQLGIIATHGAYVWNFENLNLYFGTNNARAMTIDTSQNIGIGTSSPDAKLELETDGADQELRLSCHSNTEAHTNTLSFLKSDATAASPATIDSGAVLGTIAYYGYDDNGYDTGAKIVVSADANWSSTERGTKIAFYTRDANESLSENLTINADGKVGIGLSSPTADFEIKMATDKHLLFSDSQGETGNCPTIHTVNTAGSALVDLGFRADNILFATGNAERMRLTDTGLGIGTDSPSALLDLTESTGYLNLRLGQNKTNQSAQRGGILTQPYLTAEEPTAGMLMYVSGTGGTQDTADLQLGGGHGSFNAVKQIKFYTASDAVTTSGTQVMVLDANSRFNLSNNGGTSNTVFGYQAGNLIASGDNYNVFIGHQVADADMTNATQNVGIGYQALTSLTEGDSNTAVGSGSLYSLNTGNYNVAIGHLAGDAITSAQYNTAVGYQSLSAGAGDSNTSIGYSSGLLITGSSNVTIGTDAGNVITSGTNNVVIGKGSDTDDATATNQTVVGYTTTGVADNSVTLGNADVTDVYMAQDSGATVHADYVLSQGNQNHVANTMSSPYYRLDGTDDKIEVADNTNLDFATNDFSTEALVRIPSISSNRTILGKIDHTNAGLEGYSMEVGSNGKLAGRIVGNNTRVLIAESSKTIADGLWHHICITFDRSGSSTVYVDGVADGTTDISGASGDASNSYPFQIGTNDQEANFTEMEISHARVFNNLLTATEVKELYSGASVPFKYKGANQTSLVTGDDSTFASATGFWTLLGGSGSISIGSGTLSFSSVQNGYGAKRAALVTAGKAYRATFTISNYSAGSIKVYGNGVYSTDSASSNGTHSIDLVAGNANTDFWINGIGTTTLDLDDFTLVPIGAVAEFDGSGITNDKWYDKSGNELHGTVSGATDENTAGAPAISENHPAFLVQPNATQTNIAINSTVDIVFDVERFDQGSNFASNTFTAPVTGRYSLNFNLYGLAVDSASPYIQVYLTTSNRTYTSIIDPEVFAEDAHYWSFNNSVLADMDASDTAKIQVFQSAGDAQLDIGTVSHFSGYLVC